MLQPIQKDHELICPGCGVVLGNIQENYNVINTNQKPINVNTFLLGSALEKNIKMSYQRTRQQFHEEKVLIHLVNITKEFSLPETFAIETFNELKRKNRGFHSKTEPIKQLIKILSKDDNYLYFRKLKMLKDRYESIITD